MTRPLAVLAFLLLAFAFVELWLLYVKLTKLERRVNIAEHALSKLPQGSIARNEPNEMFTIAPDLKRWMDARVPVPVKHKRKPAAKRRRKS